MAKKKTLRQISEKFRRDMQKIADRDGVTISISSNAVNNGAEIIVAKPKNFPCLNVLHGEDRCPEQCENCKPYEEHP